MKTTDALLEWNIDLTMNNSAKYEKFMQNFDTVTDDALEDAIKGDDYWQKRVKDLEEEVKDLEKKVEKLEEKEIDLEDASECDIEEQYFKNLDIEGMNGQMKAEKFFENIDKFSLEDLEEFLKKNGAVFI